MNSKKIYITIFIILFSICLGLFNLLLPQKDTINIAFCIDNKYKKILPVVIYSIHRNNISKSKYHFYIFTDTLSLKERTLLWLYIKKMGYDATIKKIDTTPVDNGKNLFLYSYTPHITRICMGKLIMVKLLPRNISKILYLDSDVIVMKDILEIYNTPLDNKIIAMIDNHDFQLNSNIIINKKPQQKYYNAGIMLIDLNKWRKNNITKQILNNTDYILKNINEQNSVPDQDVINNILADKVKELPVKYNYTYNKGSHIDPLPESEIYVRHYITEDKPHWNKSYDIDTIYFDYEKMFYKHLDTNPTLKTIYDAL